ncbi:ABC transporter substrate-binding protein [Bacillus sp. CGMCC 1.16541]|uniref:ABC transporter substrate-binding protein n=1 Tax=Bacillus sp. CGMCC 1.16541 TaxID=2185143 RepID=UPI000D73E13C|nr:ABC transporter substrate-binding protein [Bacillus sp. CGMCC 1.16541]
MKKKSCILGLIFLLLLAACSNNESKPSKEENAMKVVEHDGGKTEIPTNPKRIVSMYYVGHLLTLGIKPVGTLKSELESPFLQGKVDGIEDVAGDPIAIEKVIELEPDLIIAADERSAEELSKIAPTVVIEYGKRHAVDELKMLGDMLGKEKQANDWLASYEAKAEEAKEKISKVIGPDETVTVLEVWAKNLYVYGNKWGRGGYNLYNALNLTPPALVKENLIDNEPYLEISQEALPDVVGDHVFLSVYADNGGDKRAEELQNSGLWKQLPAAQKGNVYEIELDEFFNFDPISLEKQLDIQTELILSKLTN